MKRAFMASGLSALVLVGSLFMSGFAAAQGDAPTVDIANGVYQFVLSGNPNYCIVSNGVGHQMTIGVVGCANITITNISGSGGDKFFSDSHGNCIIPTSGNRVEVTSHRCDPTVDGWTPTHDHPYRFESFISASWLKTYGFVTGYKVWVGTGGENDWNLVRQ